MEEKVDGDKPTLKERWSVKKITRNTAIGILAFTVGYIHYRYVSNLFENDRNFSYLSELEREMSLRTEMGFYYSYYKIIVDERPYIAGITKLMYDKTVEYPKEVNAFNRFNIHPEVLIGSIYRYLESILNTTSNRECHMVDRGEGLQPVESCIGIGQPIFFYLEAIWWLAGLTVVAIFLQAASLSESILGGLLAVVQYFANHAECTRVQWAPNERENLALPLLLLQSWLLSEQLRNRDKKPTIQLQVSIFILNTLCLLFWQFTQFIFLTQTIIFFVMEQLRIIDLKSLCVFLHSHFCGLHTSVLLLQGNDMLKCSMYTSFFLVVSIYCLFFSSLRVRVETKFDFFVEAWLVVLRILIVLCTSVYLKRVVGDFLEVQDDNHVWDILISKLTDFKSFHTLIYTCSEVFDFLPASSVRNMCKTFLIPFVSLISLNVVARTVFTATRKYREELVKKMGKESSGLLRKECKEEDYDSGIENSEKKSKDLDVIEGRLKEKKEVTDNWVLFVKCLKVDAAVFYNVSQMLVYGVMAALVMRLKLLFATQMCIVSSLLINEKYYVVPKGIKKILPLLWLICILPLIEQLYVNVNKEMSHIGEFNDIQQEELLQWISKETCVTASFAGSMPILATVMLTTRRPIVAHPHYEHLEARQRAYAVYKVYGRFQSMELYQELNKLRATYLIVERKYCYGRSSKGCSFPEIWLSETAPSQSEPLCHTLLSESTDHFYPVFRNTEYAVFSVHDLSVRYMPRSFDT